MANENILRRKWDEQYQQSPERKRAADAARLDKVARDIRTKAAQRQAAAKGDVRTVARLAEEAQFEAGTDDNEIRLAALDAGHDAEVSDYVKTATQRRRELADKNDAFVNISAEPDFATHRPYAKNVAFVQGPRTAEQKAAAEINSTEWSGALNGGRKMSNADKVATYAKYGPNTFAPQELFDQHQLDVAEDGRKKAAFNERVAGDQFQTRSAMETRALAEKRKAAETSANRRGGFGIGRDDVSAPFSMGLTLNNVPDSRQPGFITGPDGQEFTSFAGRMMPRSAVYGGTMPDAYVGAPQARTVQTQSEGQSFPIIKPSGGRRPGASVMEPEQDTQNRNRMISTLGF